MANSFDEQWLQRQLAKRARQGAAIAERNAKPVKAKKPSKHKNVPTYYDGILFQSSREAERYKHLKLLEKAGIVKNIKRQKSYDLVVNNVFIGRYIADFVYFSVPHETTIVEDAKGRRIEPYPLKKKLMLACHGIEIQEV